MKLLLFISCLFLCFGASAQSNRWFGIEKADSTKWGWNLPTDMIDGMCLPQDKDCAFPIEYVYVATDTSDCLNQGYYIIFDGFWMTTKEITQEQYLSLMGKPGSIWSQSGNSLPAICTASEIERFIQKLDSIYHVGFRLPTLEEWFFAAKGGHYSEGYLYAGGNNPNHIAWYSDNSGAQLHNVGQRIPNELGLYDMTGNASEMVISDTINREHRIIRSDIQQNAKELINPSVINGDDNTPSGFRLIFPRKQHFYDSSNP